MALLQKIKEKLGFGTGAAERDETDTEVTVESDPAADEDGGSDDRGDDPAAAGTEAAASTGSMVDDEPTTGDEESEVESADAEPGSTDAEVETVDDAEVETVDDAEPEATDAGDAEDIDTAAEPAEAAGPGTEDAAVDDDDVGTGVEELKGIGPAYAERLAEIDIDSVEDLAGADAAAVAEGASVGEKRAATWIDRAKEF